MGEIESQLLGHLLSPGKSSSGGTGFHSNELSAKGVPWKFNNPGCCQDKGLLSANLQRSPISSLTSLCSVSGTCVVLGNGAALWVCREPLCHGKKV